MSISVGGFAHRTAVEVYGSFLRECVISHIGMDRVGRSPKAAAGKNDNRPVRLLTISGKGGWSENRDETERWMKCDNISLLDHLLSVARGSLMFWLTDISRSRSSETDREEIERLAHALVSIAFLHDIDKDIGLRRGENIPVDDVYERMTRYGIDKFLRKRHIEISPTAMLNYIEEVEATQAARSPAAPDYDRTVAGLCPYIELADKLEGIFTRPGSESGIDGVLDSLRDPRRWPILQEDSPLRKWEKVEIHDHLHVFLLDRFQDAVSASCKEITGRLPLIEIVHDGQLLCVVPREQASDIKEQALEAFLNDLPFRLGFSVNNRLACEFVGGEASWRNCRDAMARRGEWRSASNLISLPRDLAREHCAEIDRMFDEAGMETSWSSFDEEVGGATVKPALEHPGGDSRDLDMEPAHALLFLIIALNHKDIRKKSEAPKAKARGCELLQLMQDEGWEVPSVVTSVPETKGRERRVLLAIWTVSELWRLAEDDLDRAQELLERIVGRRGLIGTWLDGNDKQVGIASQVEDTSSAIVAALRQRFSAYLCGDSVRPFDRDTHANKRCILCNEHVDASRNVNTASRVHGIKASAFSGRDMRNDHLASASGDTHLCPVCLAELKLRQMAQEEFKGSKELPPLISSPTTTGLFGRMAFEEEKSLVSMGINDLNRIEIKKGKVYEGLDCQIQRIRLARLETLPARDQELVTQLRMMLVAVRRLGRPIHVFRGAPYRHPAIFYSDSLPAWLKRLLGGNSLRIEQLSSALSDLKLFDALANARGLGIEWAKQLADPAPSVKLGALCVAWSMGVDRQGHGSSDHEWKMIESETRQRALVLIKNTGGKPMKLKDNKDPLIRLAWLASRIQKRRSARDSANKQLLCWKTALDFLTAAGRPVSTDSTALTLGLAGSLEEELTRKEDAAAKKFRDNQPLGEACIEFAKHFLDEVWEKVFGSREPTSREQRRATAIYRFALLEIYRERGISESDNGGVTENDNFNR